jgi:anti-sigma regulatory factor (Ser/Thr protein kinase)
MEVERIAEVPGRHGEGAPEPAPRVPWQALDGLDLALRLPHDSSSAAALRHSVGGLAFALGLARALVADVRLALTEICGALLASVPADRQTGDLEVHVRVRGDRLEVRLVDRGAALGAGPGHRLSLALVAALTDAVKIRRPPEGGVEVLVTFTLGERSAASPPPASPALPPASPALPPASASLPPADAAPPPPGPASLPPGAPR